MSSARPTEDEVDAAIVLRNRVRRAAGLATLVPMEEFFAEPEMRGISLELDFEDLSEAFERLSRAARILDGEVVALRADAHAWASKTIRMAAPIDDAALRP